MGNKKPRSRSRSRSRNRERARSRNRRSGYRAEFLEPRPRGAVPPGELNRYNRPADERRNRISMLREQRSAAVLAQPGGGGGGGAAAAPFHFAPAPFQFPPIAPAPFQFAPIAPAPFQFAPIAPAPYGNIGGGGVLAQPDRGVLAQPDGGGFAFGMAGLRGALPGMIERSKTSPHLAEMAARAGPANENNENAGGGGGGGGGGGEPNKNEWGGNRENFRHRKTRKLLRRRK